MPRGKSKERFVIVGNGVAGYSAALAIGRQRKGAPVTIISAEPYPLYSPCALPEYLAGDISRKTVFLASLSGYRRAGIRTRFGERVVRIDRPRQEVVLESGDTTGYDKLVLATGSRVAKPPVKGMDEGCVALKSISDADSILASKARRAVVIGSGPIGVGAAVALRKRGLEVSLIESLPRILPRLFDDGPSGFLRRVLEQRGVKVFCEELVSEVRRRAEGMAVVTGQREIGCDLVLLAAGMVPNGEIAREAGIGLGGLNGVQVDDRMRTSADGIYACGDCIETRDALTGRHTLSLLWHTARRQGWVAGRNAAGVEQVYAGSAGYVGVDVFGVHAVSLGLLNCDDPGLSVVEKSGDGFWRSFLLKDGAIRGIQVVGDMAGIGMLMSLIRSRTPLHRVIAKRQGDFTNFLGLCKAGLVPAGVAT